jgi:hypothetical protein
LGFVFTYDDGSVAIGVVVLVAEDLGNNNQNNFDTNGNLLNLNNIGNLKWHYNNTLNKLTKANKPNTTQYYVYNYQGKRVRTVIESSHPMMAVSP